MPVVDTHEHMRILDGQIGTIYQEPIQALVVGYLSVDFLSAGAMPGEIELMQDPTVSTDAKWPLFQRFWQSCQHTAYARVTKIVLRQQYGIQQLDRAALDRVARKIKCSISAKKARSVETSEHQGSHLRLAFPSSFPAAVALLFQSGLKAVPGQVRYPLIPWCEIPLISLIFMRFALVNLLIS